MTQDSKLPILEISTLSVVVIASILAIVPRADEYLLKMVYGHTDATVESANESNSAGKAPRPVEMSEHQAMPVKLRAVAVPTRTAMHTSDEFNQFETGMNKDLMNSIKDHKQPPNANGASESCTNGEDSNRSHDQLSIDPIAELSEPEFTDSQRKNLEADETVLTEFVDTPATDPNENIDWEIDVKQPTSTDAQGRTADVTAPPASKPNSGDREDESSKLLLRDQEAGHRTVPTTEPEVSSESFGPARLLGVSPPSVFERFEFERGQIVVNQTLDDTTDLTLRASPLAGQQPQNSLARIVVDSHRSRTQKNPTLGPEFDWNEYIFRDLPRAGSVERIANAPALPIARTEGNSLKFEQLPPLDANRRMPSVPPPSAGPPAVERISRQPMSAESMQRDNAFRPIR